MLNGLRHEAMRELSEMQSSLGHTSDALWYTNECGFIRTNLQALLWDSSANLFKACTSPTTNALRHDLVASTYIAMVGACSNGIAQRIAFTLSTNFTTSAFRHGSMSHLPPGEFWYEQLPGAVGQGFYQNGGYWPMFGTWAANVIRTVNQTQGDDLIKQLAGRYRAQSTNLVPPEWENGMSRGAPQYLDSATVPMMYFQGINR